MDLCDRGDTSIIYYKVVIEFFLSGLDSGHQIPKLEFFCHKTIKIKKKIVIKLVLKVVLPIYFHIVVVVIIIK